MLSAQLVAEVARQHPTLQSLSLARNALRDVSQLAQLPHLRRLDLSANRLRAVPPLGASLEFLDLRANAMCAQLLRLLHPVRRSSLRRRRVCGALYSLLPACRCAARTRVWDCAASTSATTASRSLASCASYSRWRSSKR